MWYPEGVLPAAIVELPYEESSQIPADDPQLLERLNSERSFAKENLNNSPSWNEITKARNNSNPVSMIEDEELEKIILKSNATPKLFNESPLIVQESNLLAKSHID